MPQVNLGRGAAGCCELQTVSFQHISIVVSKVIFLAHVVYNNAHL